MFEIVHQGLGTQQVITGSQWNIQLYSFGPDGGNPTRAWSEGSHSSDASHDVVSANLGVYVDRAGNVSGESLLTVTITPESSGTWTLNMGAVWSAWAWGNISLLSAGSVTFTENDDVLFPSMGGGGVVNGLGGPNYDTGYCWYPGVYYGDFVEGRTYSLAFRTYANAEAGEGSGYTFGGASGSFSWRFDYDPSLIENQFMGTVVPIPEPTFLSGIAAGGLLLLRRRPM